MRSETLPHILKRNVTRTINILRRGEWVHHEYAKWARFPGWNEVSSHSEATLLETELGRRVADWLVTEAINKRIHGSPFGATKIVR